MAEREDSAGVTAGTEQSLAWLLALFFASGASALMYQVCWQRLLFAAFGSDIESITIIVSTFMLGLGTGASIGGEVADRWSKSALLLFAAGEACIGIFGLVSPWLLRSIGESFVAASPAAIGLISFLVLLVPTTLMGATLPLLVAHLAKNWSNVGRSIGVLYVANTAGAALGTFTIGFVWLYLFSLDAAVYLAAIINFMVSAVAWKKSAHRKPR